MAKDKKTRKGHGEETGEEVANRDAVKGGQDAAVATSGKKTKKNKKGDDWVEDITEEISSLSLKNAKESGKTKPRADSESDNENEPVKEKKKAKDADEKKKKGKSSSIIEDAEPVTETKTKKKKSRSKRVELSDDDEDELPSLTSSTKKKGAVSDDSENEILGNKKSSKSQKKSSGAAAAAAPDVFSTKAAKFQLLDVEDDDMKGLDAESDDDDKQQQQQQKEEESRNDSNKEEQKKGGKKSKKKERRKRDEDDEDIDKLLEELALEMTGQKPAEKPPEMPREPTAMESGPPEVDAAEDFDAKQEKKKRKKKKKDDTKQDEEKEATPTLEQGEEEGHTVKTAAEKRKEKKERDKQKKLAQAEQKAKSAGGEVKSRPKETTPEPAPEPVKEAPEPSPPKDEAEEDEEIGGKKKKKKKKDEEEKKDKKRPGKKQIAAMQEALKKVQEEEERLKREEEAKLRAEEEAERRRQEQLRLEQERKERKKQREKEKRERLKAEGKLLTKTQKQNRARMEATLAALRQQGVEVPQIGEKKERAPRLGDRRRFSKKKNENQTDSEKVEPEPAEIEEVSPEQKNDAEPTADVNEAEKEEEKSASEEDVKEAWDETTDDEEEKQVSSKKVEIVIKSKPKHSSEESGSDETESSEESEESESEEEESSSESENEGKTSEEKIRERAMERIKKRREEAENNRSTSKLRSPVVCVLGHVDTGKTKILDKIRYSHVQDSEAGGITQQIGATMVPQDALKEQCKMVKNFVGSELQVPGLLIIDTPGHESFSNLRSRGSSLCDIAILVVDIMHGLEPQTIESINLLKQKKTPFIVALNKIDRLYEWKPMKNKDIHDVVKSQSRNTKMEFDDRAKDVILQFANQGLNAVLYYENKDPRSYISMVPTSAISGDGMGNLMALVVELTQSMMAKRLAFSEELQATVLEVKAIPGLGTTIDVILVNGRLHEGDTICLAGHEGPLVTQIRSLLMPQPLKELRVKNQYQEFKEVEGAQGVKITGKDLDKAIAGLQLLVAQHPDEVAVLKEEIASSFQEAMNAIKLAERGVYVQASTLGSLEALLDFLRTSKIPYSGIRIGPVVKKDVMKASIMLEHDSQYAVILAFDVKIERDAQELADSLGVRIFQADIIYHLFDKFMEYREELKNKKREEFKNIAVFPCKLRILPQYVFNSRDPIVVGVSVEAGVVKEGTPLCVPSKDFLDIGTVTTIEINHKPIENARKGQEVCIKVEPVGGEAPKMFGRHFDHTDVLVSKITRQSIDVCKEYFRDDLLKTDWQLMVELKKLFQIL